MSLPHDYAERVYAGVLGKLIGVYLGRPFEGWSHEAIMERLGEINYYVHEQLDVPLIVTDDDITGTFTFLRALPDRGNSLELSPAQIGESWLNYLIEERTILWWGGLGNSTEHTAYLRLKHGVEAPRSGSMELNGQVVAEQIGAQIFIDGWAMVAPGDPERAADLARRAGSVSHDGVAIHGAQVIAAMEAAAFVESDRQKLIDIALDTIPRDSLIRVLIDQIRSWHAQSPEDWRGTRDKIAASFGYDKYGGNCHMVPNHALIIHALLHGDDDFQKSLMIVNTCGWDTDCNSGNLGCLLGIKNGLAGIDAGPDFRGPIADRLYLPTADGGRAITDAVTETYHIVNIGRALSGGEPLAPKAGARFHFEMPGSVQGFTADERIESKGTTTVENVTGHSETGSRSLALHFRGVTRGRPARAGTATFIPSNEIADYFDRRGYALLASPTLYPGQTVTAAVGADSANREPVSVNLYLRRYVGGEDSLELVCGPEITLDPGERQRLSWPIEGAGSEPIAEIGLEVRSEERRDGTVYLDYLGWSGAANATFERPDLPGDRRAIRMNPSTPMWRRVWLNGVDSYEPWWPETFRLVQNEGRGLLSTGTADWADYRVQSAVNIHLAAAAGIAARVQGLRRYYGLLLCADGYARLVRVMDGETVLAEAEFPLELGTTYSLCLSVEGDRIRGEVDGKSLFDVEDGALSHGGIAFVVEEGRIASESISVSPEG